MSTSSAERPVRRHRSNGAGSVEALPQQLEAAGRAAEAIVPGRCGATRAEHWRDGIDARGRRDRGADDLADAAGRRTGSTRSWRLSSRCRRGRRRDRAGRRPAPSRLGRVLLPLRARHAARSRPARRSTSRGTTPSTGAMRSLATRDVYRDGFWEPEVHRALRDRATGCGIPPSSSSPGALGRVRRVHAAAARARARATAASAAHASPPRETSPESLLLSSCRSSCWRGRFARSSPGGGCA